MIWTWIGIALVIVVLLVAFKFKEIRHKFSLIVIALVLIFLIFSFTQIYQTNKVDLTTFDGVVKVGQLYFTWLGGLFSNIGKVGAYAIHQDWGLNATNSTLK